ncbi:D-amino-acid transaminase [Rhodobacteraceae bacterium F11138]|nr:D-amino-acid transaminase [Rhodobacteraceae bacterium F11138]
MTEDADRIVYLNGAFLPAAEARVSVFDRGFLMADAVYEYTAVLDGRLIDFDGHMQRLERSLGALGYEYRVDRADMLTLHREMVARNRIDVGGVYLQVSRGAAERNFIMPRGIEPTIMSFTQRLNFIDHPLAETGLKFISVEDSRWARCDIKSVQLLYTSMAKTRAAEAGVNDALFVRDGYVTEATASNVFIVRDGTVVTRPRSTEILPGVTRRSVIELCARHDLKLEERAFTVAEVQAADEAFITASPMYVLPMVEVDGQPIGDGTVGELTRKLRSIFLADARASAV